MMPLHHHMPAPSQIKSRWSFATANTLLKRTSLQTQRDAQWEQPHARTLPSNAVQDLIEKLADGTLPARQKWCTQNKESVEVCKMEDNVVKRGFKD